LEKNFSYFISKEKHFVTDCQKTKKWFIDLGEDKNKILERIWDENLENIKGRLLKKL